jgi:pyruvate formate lyase activating enzyme
MKIREFLKESINNYPGKISSVVFSAGCNYRCPACHAKHIINEGNEVNENEIFSYLESRKGWVEGVVLCGGEPTVYQDLPEFARKIKERGLDIKLDTNGSNPEMIQDMLEKRLVDYIAMDIKAPKYMHSYVTGKKVDIEALEKSMILLTNSVIDYEFRTTIVPIINRDIISFPGLEYAEGIAKWIIDCTGKNNHSYYLQKFVARENNVMLDERLSKENLTREMRETPDDLMTKILINARKYLPRCEIR